MECVTIRCGRIATHSSGKGFIVLADPDDPHTATIQRDDGSGLDFEEALEALERVREAVANEP